MTARCRDTTGVCSYDGLSNHHHHHHHHGTTGTTGTTTGTGTDAAAATGTIAAAAGTTTATDLTAGVTVTVDVDCLAETLAFNAEFAAGAARRPDRSALDAAGLAELRSNRLAGDSPPVRLPEGGDRTVTADGGEVVMRCFTPPTVAGVYLHLHGGGWMFGSADGQDERLWALARAGNLAVVSVGYRLAPEHPYPAAISDCVRAARWLIDNCAAEFGTRRLLIGGESAGAYLAVATLLRLRDRHGVTGAFRAAQLTFGPYDLSMTPSQRSFGARPLLSNTETLRATYAAYAPGRAGDELRDPQLSPLYADLSGLPPARLVVGSDDPLRDDSLFLAARWRAAGGRADVAVVAGAMHGFTLFPLTVTARETRREAEFLAGVG